MSTGVISAGKRPAPPSRHREFRHTFTGACLLSFALLPATVSANDWWQQGQDFLRGLGGSEPQSALGEQQIADGLREALRVGGEAVVGRLGQNEGFNLDPVAHIPLPKRLRQLRDTLARAGLSGSLDDLELRLNRAAELAVPRARELFLDAVSQMTLADARNILQGPNDAATRFFEGQMRPELLLQMRPVIDQSLANVGALQVYDDLQGNLAGMPWIPDLRTDLGEHVAGSATDAVFHYLAEEEAAIRQNPARRTTELLKQVFGQ